MRQLDSRYNFLDIWLFSDTTTARYFEVSTLRKLPQCPACWLAWQVSHDKDLLPYTRAVITLKNRTDLRRVLDRKIIDLDKFYELF